MPPPDTLRLVYWLCLVIYPTLLIISWLVIITLVWTFKGELYRCWWSLHSPRTSQQLTLWLPTSTRETPGEAAASSPVLFPSCAVVRPSPRQSFSSTATWAVSGTGDGSRQARTAAGGEPAYSTRSEGGPGVFEEQAIITLDQMNPDLVVGYSITGRENERIAFCETHFTESGYSRLEHREVLAPEALAFGLLCCECDRFLCSIVEVQSWEAAEGGKKCN